MDYFNPIFKIPALREQYRVRYTKTYMKSKYDIQKYEALVGGFYVIRYENQTENVTLVEKCQMNCKGFIVFLPQKNVQKFEISLKPGEKK